MSSGVGVIPLGNLALAFVAPAAVVAILFAWSLRAGNAIYALARMLGQLLLIGYLLTFIFESNSLLVVLAVLALMVVASSWIALSSVTGSRTRLLGHAVMSIGLTGSVTLVVVILAVLELDPWYEPRFVIPLAGMVFANSMNNVSLTAERAVAEVQRGARWIEARNTALQAGLIPTINSLFAVGLVSLPGMMTGQILSGVSPLVAVRYQVVVMCMIFGAGGLSAVAFLVGARRQLVEFAAKGDP